MGGESSSTQTQNQTQYTTPYGYAQRPLQGLLGQVGSLPAAGPTSAQNTAFNNLVSLGQQGNPFAGGITNVANQMLSGGPDRTGIGLAGYNQFQDQMGATARGDYLDPNKNPFFGATTAGALEKSLDEYHRRLAGAGVNPTGMGSYGQQIGETVTDTLAPYFMNAYNQERQNQLGAQQGLFGASNQTAGLLSGLDAQRFANQQGGIGAAQEATGAQKWGDMQVIAAEAARQGVTTEQLMQRMGILMPAAQAFGTTTATGTKTGTADMSGADQFNKITTGIGSLWA